MSKFVLSAQMQLQAPKNVNAVLRSVNSQLKGIKAVVDIQIDPRSQKALTQMNKAMKGTKKEAKESGDAIENLGKQAALAARRYGAFVTATFAFRALISKIKEGIGEAIDFQREVVKISQVTGKSVGELKALTQEVTRLSTTLGVSSSELVLASRTLAQAGLTATDTRKALEALAKSDLSPTFDSITQTTEGAIAIFRQFGVSADELEGKLGAINAVSKKFAVESGDIIAAVRRTGGAFASAGGSLEELIALFTSVRSTTRESAESIATGFRTIFTRLQRVSTISFLRDFGVELQNMDGQFVGPIKAIAALSKGLKGLKGTDPRFAQIIEELGGFRQVSKVIPLIKQYDVTQRALNVALAGGGSLAKDAETAQGALAIQIKKVREEFNALIRKFSDNSALQGMVDLSLRLARALIKVADAIEPLVPVIAGLGVLSATSVTSRFLGKGKSKGGDGFSANILGFNNGGIVPGSGNGDTVPAMLEPGEFVLRKKATQGIGVQNLQKLNIGGPFEEGRTTFKISSENAKNKATGIAGINISKGAAKGKKGISLGAAFLLPEGLNETVSGIIPLQAFPQKSKSGGDKAGGKNDIRGLISRNLSHKALSGANTKEAGKASGGVNFRIESRSLSKSHGEAFENDLIKGITIISNRFAKRTLNDAGSTFSSDKFKSIMKDGNKFNFSQISGNVFEAALASSGAPFDTTIGGANRPIDFPTGLGKAAGAFQNGGRLSSIPTDAKRTFNRDSIASLVKKIKNKVQEDAKSGAFTSFASSTFNQGGGVGTDTVNALLTPGEFVFNKDTVKRIGMNNLEDLNAQRFAKGGAVGPKKFQGGGGVLGGAVGLGIAGSFASSFGEGGAISDFIGELSGAVIQFGILNQVLGTNNLSKMGDNLTDFGKGVEDTARKLLRVPVPVREVGKTIGRSPGFNNVFDRDNKPDFFPLKTVRGTEGFDNFDGNSKRFRFGAKGRGPSSVPFAKESFLNRSTGLLSGGVDKTRRGISGSLDFLGKERKAPFSGAFKNQRLGTGLKVGAGLAVAGSAAKSFYSSQAQKQLESNDISGAKESAKSGDTADKVLKLAGAGAALGSAFGPAGIAVGGLVGALGGLALANDSVVNTINALTGGLFGLETAASKIQTQIDINQNDKTAGNVKEILSTSSKQFGGTKSEDIQRAIEEFDKLSLRAQGIESISDIKYDKDGKVVSGGKKFISPGIDKLSDSRGFIDAITFGKFGSLSDREVEQGRLNKVQASAQEQLDSIAPELSKSIIDFTSKGNKVNLKGRTSQSLKASSGFTDLDVEALEKLLQAQRLQAAIMAQQNKELAQFNAVLGNSQLAIQSMNRELQVAQGQITKSFDFSAIFSQAESGNLGGNTETFERLAGGISGLPGGDRIGQGAIAESIISKNLSAAVAQGQSGGGENFANKVAGSIRDSLEDAGVSTDIINEQVAKLLSTFGSDEELNKKLGGSPGERAAAIEKIQKNFTDNISALGKAVKQQQAHQDALAGIFSARLKAESVFNGRINKVKDIRLAGEELIAKTLGTTVKTGVKQSFEKSKFRQITGGIGGGADDPRALADAAARAKESLADFSKQQESTSIIDETARAKEQAALERATNGLKFLADGSKLAANAIAELQKEQGLRGQRTGLAERLATTDRKKRGQLERDIKDAQAFAGGNTGVARGLSPERISSLLGIIKTGGVVENGNEVAKQFLKIADPSAVTSVGGIDASPKELLLLEEAKKQLKVQEKANLFLANIQSGISSIDKALGGQGIANPAQALATAPPQQFATQSHTRPGQNPIRKTPRAGRTGGEFDFALQQSNAGAAEQDSKRIANRRNEFQRQRNIDFINGPTRRNPSLQVGPNPLRKREKKLDYSSPSLKRVKAIADRYNNSVSARRFTEERDRSEANQKRQRAIQFINGPTRRNPSLQVGPRPNLIHTLGPHGRRGPSAATNNITPQASSNQGGQSFGQGSRVLEEASQNISRATSNLAGVLNNFPKDISHTINGTVEVVINGAEALAGLQPHFVSLINNKVAIGINAMLRSKFQNAGQVPVPQTQPLAVGN